jgi:hypothetical protein
VPNPPALADARAFGAFEKCRWHVGSQNLEGRCLEPGNAVFRNAVENPALPLGPGQAWGAKSGYVKVAPGETISFECEYHNNLAETVRFGETSHDKMCNVFGHYNPSAGGMWDCFPH